MTLWHYEVPQSTNSPIICYLLFQILRHWAYNGTSPLSSLTYLSAKLSEYRKTGPWSHEAQPWQVGLHIQRTSCMRRIVADKRLVRAVRPRADVERARHSRLQRERHAGRRPVGHAATGGEERPSGAVEHAGAHRGPAGHPHTGQRQRQRGKLVCIVHIVQKWFVTYVCDRMSSCPYVDHWMASFNRI